MSTPRHSLSSKTIEAIALVTTLETAGFACSLPPMVARRCRY
jgi:hypothetical protein